MFRFLNCSLYVFVYTYIYIYVETASITDPANKTRRALCKSVPAAQVTRRVMLPTVLILVVHVAWQSLLPLQG